MQIMDESKRNPGGDEQPSPASAPRTIVEAGVSYFSIVFSAGFVLGLIRTLWLVPAVGVRTAELAEMPIMLVVIVLAARFVVLRYRMEQRRSLRVGTGVLALAILLLAEIGLVVLLQERPLGANLASRDPISGSVYLGMLAVFAAMPLLCGRKQKAHRARNDHA